MIAFIDAHRVAYGVESICEQLPIAPSTYYEHKARHSDASREPPRVQRDRRLRANIKRVWQANFEVYGVRKVWRQLNRRADRGRALHRGAADEATRLCGAVRGREFKTTTVFDEQLRRPGDLVNRNFVVKRPNALRVSHLTYVATWRGFVYVAFVIDAFARFIVGWLVSTSLRSDLAVGGVSEARHFGGVTRIGPTR